MKNQNKAYLYGIIAVLLWSTVASAFKVTLRYMDHLQLLFYSNITSVVVFGLILLLKKRFMIIFSFSGKQYARSLILGILNPFLYYLVLFKAFELLPAQEAQPLNYTWALMLTFLSIPLLKQKIGVNVIIAGFVSYSGVLVISSHGDIFDLHFSDPLGVTLALGSTVIWALFWIYNTKDNRDPVAALFLNFIFGLPLVTFACALFSNFHVANAYGLFGAIYVGLFEMGITFVFWISALKFSENTAKVGNLIFISPFISLIFIQFFVGEQILASTLIGLILIIIGLIIQRFDSMKPFQESRSLSK